MKVKNESEVAQSCPTLSDPMDCSPPDSVHGVFQARVLKWGAIDSTAYMYPIKVLKTNGLLYIPTGGGHGNQLQYSLPGKSQGWRSLASYSPWGHRESDTTERLSGSTHSKRDLQTFPTNLFQPAYLLVTSPHRCSKLLCLLVLTT